MSIPIKVLSVSPNPFYPDGGGFLETTSIVFQLERSSLVWINIFSFDRKQVRTLASAERMTAGSHEIVWDGLNQAGGHLPAGIYMVEVLAQIGAAYYSSAMRVLTASSLTEYPGPVYTPANQQAEFPCVLFDKHSFGLFGGTPYLMWYDSPEPPLLSPQINMASSSDGVNWTDEGSVSGLTNPSRCFVLYSKGINGIKFKMWYRDSLINNSINAIRYAESSDGLFWFNNQPVTQHSTNRLVTGEPGTWNPYTFGPCFVLYTPDAPNTGIYPENHRYAMYYNVSPDLEKQSTALAFSSDGLQWQVAQNVPVLAGTDYGGEELPDIQYSWDEYSVVLNSMARTPSGLWVGYYSAGDDFSGIHKGIGFAMSATGLVWLKGSSSDPLMHINDSVTWRDSKTYTPFIVADRDKFSGYGDSVRVKMWFSGAEAILSVHPEERSGIGYAVLTAELAP